MFQCKRHSLYLKGHNYRVRCPDVSLFKKKKKTTLKQSKLNMNRCKTKTLEVGVLRATMCVRPLQFVYQAELVLPKLDMPSE